MPILSLPDSTVRAIGSSLVLSDAASVVKELIDNAIDASSTIISVELSADTLDIIQVRDNGSGIGVQDRQLLCKRGCTSKIRTIEDLEALGGSSLGFRGEALACISELSEGVAITTRVDGEAVGSLLNYGPAGKLLSSASASHPIGTTIRIRDFLKLLPVRKQTALKTAWKTLASIKKLLHAYAFARPAIRLSLKVLKGKNDKANWQYSPIENTGSLKDAATKIVGRDVATRCELRTSTISTDVGRNTEGDGTFSAYALLASVDKDTSKMNNIGHFLSVDGRPMAPTRGTMKEIVKLYRTYFRNASAQDLEGTAASDPFLCIQLSCPRSSYDVNVEPAKDDVLFSNTEMVMSLVESLFKDLYGDFSDAKASNASNKLSDVPSGNAGSFSLLLARRPVQKSVEAEKRPVSIPESVACGSDQRVMPIERSPQTSRETFTSTLRRDNFYDDHSSMLKTVFDDELTLKPGSNGRSNMYTYDHEDDLVAFNSSPISQDGEADCEERENSIATNPWSIAKLNAPARSHMRPSSSEVSSDIQLLSPQSNLSVTPQQLRLLSLNKHRVPLGTTQDLPSPISSPHSARPTQNPGPPLRRRAPVSDVAAEAEKLDQSNSDSGFLKTSSEASLDEWVRSANPRAESPSFQRVSAICKKAGNFIQGGTVRSPEGHENPMDQTLNEARQNDNVRSHLRQPDTLGRPFKSPLILRDEAYEPGEMSHMPEVRGSTQQPSPDQAPNMPPPPSAVSSIQPIKLSQSLGGDLDQIMEFEYRKKAVLAQQRKSEARGQGRGLGVTRLAHLHKASTVQTLGHSGFPASDNEAASEIDGPSNMLDAAESLESQFGALGRGVDCSSGSNPHRNRYLAAAKALSRTAMSHSHHVQRDLEDSEAREITEAEEGPRLSDDDPRASLMLYKSQKGSSSSNGLAQTGPKISRAKTAKMPLESVPIDAALHDLVLKVPYTTEETLAAHLSPNLRDGSNVYTTSGKPSLVKWTSVESEVDEWQTSLTKMLQAMYRARVSGDLVIPSLELELKRAIKAHCDSL